MAEHSSKKREEYDWIDDPFDDKKTAEEQRRVKRSNGLVAGIGCAVVIVAVIVIVILLVMMLSSTSVM